MSVVSSESKLNPRTPVILLMNPSSKKMLRHVKNSSVDVVETYVAQILLCSKCADKPSSPRSFKELNHIMEVSKNRPPFLV